MIMRDLWLFTLLKLILFMLPIHVTSNKKGFFCVCKNKKKDTELSSEENLEFLFPYKIFCKWWRR